MGWFNKKEDARKEAPKFDSLSSLPKLPELPELPSLKTDRDSIQQLPSFPTSSLGERFSQSTIKEAVTRSSAEKNDFYSEGKKGEEGRKADEFTSKKTMMPMMQRPSSIGERGGYNFSKTQEMEDEEDFDDVDEFEKSEFEMPEDLDYEEEAEEEKELEPSYTPSRKKSATEPVFIRIDKFEASLRTFEKIRREIDEVERLLKEISRIKDEEEKQLHAWQNNLVKVKDQIEKVNRDIFSKLE